MMMNYRSYSERLLSELLRLLESSPMKEDVELIALKRNQVLLEPGQKSSMYYFLKKGLLVNYYLHDGKEIVTSFTFPGEVGAEFKTSVLRQSSQDFMVSIMPGVTYRISTADFERYKVSNPILQKIETGLIIAYALLLEERLFFTQHKTAMERYAFLIENYPEFIQVIPLKYIASYLGITLETLSRIRTNS